MDLIKHYYPDTFIEDEKYLLNTRCSSWNKKQDILTSLKKYKSTANIDTYLSEVPINDLYQFYCGSKNKFTVSKRYFENFIKDESELFIVEDNFIKVNSFDNIK